jgi:hypothetical protein
MAKKKLQIALYWGAACGGCDVAVLDTDEFILDVAAAADIRFWPLAVDGKYADVERMTDGELDLTLFHGAVRNSENEHVAKLLRRKSKTLSPSGAAPTWAGSRGWRTWPPRRRSSRACTSGTRPCRRATKPSRSRGRTSPPDSSSSRPSTAGSIGCKTWWRWTTSSRAVRRPPRRSRPYCWRW